MMTFHFRLLALLCCGAAASHYASDSLTRGHAASKHKGHLRHQDSVGLDFAGASLEPANNNGKDLQLPAPSENSKAMANFVALIDQSPDDDVTETEYESWFERMTEALIFMLLSPFVLSLSIAILWNNERRAARMDALIVYGAAECVSVEEASPDNRGELLHVASGKAVAKAPVESKLFKSVVLKECLTLQTTVEVFQWIEHSETKEKKDMVGGGKTKTTTYSYEKKWSSKENKSERYHNKKMRNQFPVEPKVEHMLAPRVEYEVDDADGWILPADLVKQFTDFVPATSAIGSDEVVCASGGLKLKREDDYFYSASSRNPKIGDVRAIFEYVPDNQDATIVAVQAASKARQSSSMTETFLPYRPIPRGCCGISDDEKKKALLAEGERSRDNLAKADECNLGPLVCLCCCCFCCCNLVSGLMAKVSPAQIFNLYVGSISKRECFSKIQMEAAGVKWALRLVGWFIMYIAVMLFFQPLFMLLNVVPFLEYLHLTDAVEFVVGMLSLMVTAIISFMIVSIAYLAYRPFVAIVYFTIAAAIAAVPLSIYMGYLTPPI